MFHPDSHGSTTGSWALQLLLLLGRATADVVEPDVHEFLETPLIVAKMLQEVDASGGFPHGLAVQDRDAFNTQAYSLMNSFPTIDGVYFGSETGMMVGYNQDFGTYREPGNDGYPQDDASMAHHHQACVNRVTGDARTCDLQEGAEYVECHDNDCTKTSLELCPDPESQKPCDEETTDCSLFQKWCPKYETRKATANNYLGYIPRTWYCHGQNGKYTQEPGTVLEADGALGNCVYQDGHTMVQRSISGTYAYCQDPTNKNSSTSCDGVFEGGFRSENYDPRLQPSYIATKQSQDPQWTEPYVLSASSSLQQPQLGITYTEPFYTQRGRQRIFAGVFSVDVTLDSLTQVLSDDYEAAAVDDDLTLVAIFEKAEPHYLVATNTRHGPSRWVLKDDEDVLCNDDDAAENCRLQRVKMSEVHGNRMDDALQSAYQKHSSNDFPEGMLLSQAINGNGTYVSQRSSYSTGKNLDWTILVVSPLARPEALPKEHYTFVIVCCVSTLGSVLCVGMAFLFYSKRKKHSVRLADWWFTQAFLIGCAIVNLSTFVYFLGELSDALCMARMWAFPLCFSAAISPLFVKTYRVFALADETRRSFTGSFVYGYPERNRISNARAAVLTLPVIVIQAIILLVCSIVDPPTVSPEEPFWHNHFGCYLRTNAVLFAIWTFGGLLVFAGCVLAFVTSRRVNPEYVQARELAFAMYNVFFVTITLASMLLVAEIDIVGTMILFSASVFFATVFSSAAFSIPPLVGPESIVSAERGSRVRFAHPSTIYETCFSTDAQCDHEYPDDCSATEDVSNSARGDFWDGEPFDPLPLPFPYQETGTGVSHIPACSSVSCPPSGDSPPASGYDSFPPSSSQEGSSDEVQQSTASNSTTTSDLDIDKLLGQMHLDSEKTSDDTCRQSNAETHHGSSVLELVVLDSSNVHEQGESESSESAASTTDHSHSASLAMDQTLRSS